MSSHEVKPCRSCGTEMRWATTTKGKRIPLDNEPSGEGTIALAMVQAEGGVMEVAVTLHDKALGEARQTGVILRAPHFQTCPNADEHRKARP
jgi:hypothetical protein